MKVLQASSFVCLLAGIVSCHELLAANFEPKVSKIPTIEVVGNKLFYSNNSQFFIKGIAYQQSRAQGDIYDPSSEAIYVDPMAHPQSCLRDLENLKELGVNAVRVYSIDPKANHDECMNAFGEAGIYILADLSEPDLSINRVAPTWDIDLYNRYSSVITALQKYNNVLGFFAGNEVTNDKTNTDASPFVKASVRDMKQFIIDQKYRKIPIGYTTNDDAEIREQLAKYFVCDNSNETVVDFFGINMYEWCGYSTYTTSGYRERTLEMQDYPVPIFFSEYGCNIHRPRPFTEVEALYGSTMSKVWSGGIAYMYFEEENQYGVVSLKPDGTVEKLEDFKYLKKELNAATPKGISKPDYLSSVSSQKKNSVTCPSTSGVWKASAKLPQTPDAGKCQCLQSTLSCILTPYKKVDELEMLKKICSEIDCSEITADASQGRYGRFSDCGLRQRLSYAINKQYIQNGRKTGSCDLDGYAISITNSDSGELSSLLTSDGRTCLDAIGPEINYMSTKEKAETNTANTSLGKKGGIYKNNEYRGDEKVGNFSSVASYPIKDASLTFVLISGGIVVFTSLMFFF